MEKLVTYLFDRPSCKNCAILEILEEEVDENVLRQISPGGQLQVTPGQRGIKPLQRQVYAVILCGSCINNEPKEFCENCSDIIFEDNQTICTSCSVNSI